MSCLHPLLARPTGNLTKNGKIEYKLSGARYVPDIQPGDVPVPCGKCIGCRLDYSRSWADRMMLELDHSKKAVFLTLTYNNAHLHYTANEETGEYGCMSLDKRDMQLFMKRLRKRYPNKELRFYGCGEYGSQTWRPHFHIVVFGLGLDDFKKDTLRQVGINKLNQPYYTCPEIENTWSILKYRKEPCYGKKGQLLKKVKKVPYYDPIGFVTVEDVSWHACAYVARYVTKKIYADYNAFLDLYGAEPEFSLMSRDPGIGAYFLQDHPEQADCSLWFSSGKAGAIRPSRFYQKQLEKINPVLYNKTMEERKQFARDNVLLTFLQTDKDYIQQQEVEENEKLRQAGILKKYRSL